MRRPEIDAKYDRIVAFADIGQFIDTPIKYYSSGMEVRLGFAVAAHLDPDIMLVDEVLAVGDVGFQAKCLNKLAELKEQDRTIVLVSHNTIAILQHCDRVIWIDHGTVRAVGEPEAIIEQYLHSVHPQSAGRQSAATADTPIRITDVTVRGADQQVADTLEHGRPGILEIGYEVLGPVGDPVVYVGIHDANGHPLGGLTTRLDGLKLDTDHGNGVVRLVFAPVTFTRGRFRVTVAILDSRLQRYLDLRPDAISFAVDGPSVGSREVYGHVVYPHRWEVDADDA